MQNLIDDTFHATILHAADPDYTDGATRRVLTAFRWVPEMVQGMVRDVRVRWALEEAGLSYDVQLIGMDELNTPAHRALQPFGQIPVYRENGLTLFESGAIVHHIASGSPALMPADAAGRSRTLTWMFAALNTVEPAVAALAELDFFGAGDPAALARRPALLERVETKLSELDHELADRDYLLDRFSAADILMTSVLRVLRNTGSVARFPALHAYFERCNARPASRKAMADHLAVFAQHRPE